MTRREVAHVRGEVLEPYPRVRVPVPGELEPWAHPIVPARVVVEHVFPAAPAEVEPAEPSKTIPWLLVALALAILVFACFAAWHTWVGPQLVPVRSQHSVDLVGPHR